MIKTFSNQSGWLSRPLAAILLFSSVVSMADENGEDEREEEEDEEEEGIFVTILL